MAKILVENADGTRIYRERSEIRVLNEREERALGMKITPELLKSCGAIEATKFIEMVKNGKLQQ